MRHNRKQTHALPRHSNARQRKAAKMADYKELDCKKLMRELKAEKKER